MSGIDPVASGVDTTLEQIRGDNGSSKSSKAGDDMINQFVQQMETSFVSQELNQMMSNMQDAQSSDS